MGLVVNAACKFADYAHIAARLPSDVLLEIHEERALLALQGPEAVNVLVSLGADVANWDFMQVGPASLAGIPVFLSRSGYTGEDGFEITLPAAKAEGFWQALADAGVKPIGLGARDTLRLEAGMNLYGQDMDETVSPLDAGLAWTVDLVAERDFVGKAALLAQGQQKQFLGLLLLDKGVLRAHQKVVTVQGDGEITSGTFSPTLQQSVALARLPMGVAIGDSVKVVIRDKELAAKVVKPCFARNGKSMI